MADTYTLSDDTIVCGLRGIHGVHGTSDPLGEKLSD